MSKADSDALIRRYKANYSLPEDAEITEEMILAHWNMEKRITRELLDSTPENRWDVFERCYTELFMELEWLNRIIHSDIAASPASAYGYWKQTIGNPPQSIYEVGSGKGELIRYLADCGFECRGTEITRERGEKWTTTHPNLTWSVCDGVHLDKFEAPHSYDTVISSQVIEHLHPDDLIDHLRGVRAILKSGGRYIFTTPHISIGPCDISKVFLCEKAIGTHLKEYTYGEMARLMKQAGFVRSYAVLRLPHKISTRLAGRIRPRPSAAYLAYVCIVEKLLGAIPKQPLRFRAARAAKLILFEPTIMMVGQNG